MPCLLYCVTQPVACSPPSTGVRGAAVDHVDHNGVRCFYSAVGAVPRDAEALKREALEFHQVTRSLFQQCDIIPFRFPTVLPSPADIAHHLDERAQQYATALAQFHGAVQMEIRLALSDRKLPAARSGTDYLKARSSRTHELQQASDSCRAALGAEVIDWRADASTDGVHCFALVKREAVTKLQQQLQQLRLHGRVTAVLSGPWPPTAFLPRFT